MKANNQKSSIEITGRLPIGAEVLAGGGVFFRVWAPCRKRVEVVLEPQKGSSSQDPPLCLELTSEPNGYFSLVAASAGPGWRYRYRLDGIDDSYPDPASRFQPEGPLGPSQVIDPGQFLWTDHQWPGIALPGQIIYEIHVGTFTPQGNWQGAASQLPALAETGITAIEMMPVGDFSGDFGWGYDGVDLFAPAHLYGEPDDLRFFVDRAHALGIGVILDVVFNHLGPIGNFLKKFSPAYFSDRYTNEWGEAINYDGRDSGPVREFITANAAYWINEFHMDGLRIDATQQIYDNSSEHILKAVVKSAREAAGQRTILVIAENEPQLTKLVRATNTGGYGLDGLWNDDFHHSAMVALTGHNQAYYTDYQGNPQEFISSLKWGYLYQGQLYKWQKKRRGAPCFGLDPHTFVLYIQNHDQIANSGCGLRVHRLTSPALYRAMTALLLLAPGTPLLFQGQEFAASSPFFYFSDVSPGLADSIHQSRLKFLSQFRGLNEPEMQTQIPKPGDRQTFELSKLNLTERELHNEVYALHCALLKLRRRDAVFRSQRKGGVDGAVLSSRAFVLRFFGDEGDDRLLIVNLGGDLHLDPAPEPLLAPPEGKLWRLFWSSESPAFGGAGTPPLETEENWQIPGSASVVLVPVNPEDKEVQVLNE